MTDDRQQLAEDAAIAMGWRFNDYGTHTNWTSIPEAMCRRLIAAKETT